MEVGTASGALLGGCQLNVGADRRRDPDLVRTLGVITESDLGLIAEGSADACC